MNRNMNELLVCIILLIAIAPVALAQTPAPSNASAQPKREYYRWEGYVGYSNLYLLNDLRPVGLTISNGHVYAAGFKESTRLFKGFEISGVRNLQRYFGMKVDFSRNLDTRSTLFEVSPNNPQWVPLRSRGHQIIAGFQIKDNDETKTWKPFVSVLGGLVGRSSEILSHGISYKEGVGYYIDPHKLQKTQASNWYGTIVFGGGLDLKLTERIDLRLVQVDYGQNNGGGDKRFRLGTGVAFR